MKKSYIISILIVLSSVVVLAQDNVVFTDSLTGVQLCFPQGTNVKKSNGFKRAEADLGTSYVSLYAMKSADGKQFSWSRINEFDRDDKFGSLLKSERVSDDVDGWVRYYQTRGKRKDYISCVTLIRGKEYAFYILETAYQQENLQTPIILQTAQFPKAPAPLTGISYLIVWIVAGALFLFPLIFFPWLKKLSNKVYLILAILEIAVFCIWCVTMMDFGWITILLAGGPFVGFLLVSLTDSWWEAIAKFFENLST